MNKWKMVRGLFMGMSSISVLVLKLGMLAVALQASALAIIVHDTMMHNPLLVTLRYPTTLEYVALSFTLVLGGAILFDLLEKEKADQ